jgi:hypothetical protein
MLFRWLLALWLAFVPASALADGVSATKVQKHVLMPPTVSASIKTPTQIMCAGAFNA